MPRQARRRGAIASRALTRRARHARSGVCAAVERHRLVGPVCATRPRRECAAGRHGGSASAAGERKPRAAILQVVFGRFAPLARRLAAAGRVDGGKGKRNRSKNFRYLGLTLTGVQ